MKDSAERKLLAKGVVRTKAEQVLPLRILNSTVLLVVVIVVEWWWFLRVLVSCVEAGDDVADDILLDSVEELASSVKAVVQRLGLTSEGGEECFPLVMVGGVLDANKRWDISKEVIASISKDYPGVVGIRPKVEPAMGAALLAWNFIMENCHQQGYGKTYY